MVELHPRVLELLVSRICHDLVSPVGAVSNGIELMEELGASATDDAVSLISSSALQASQRLKCFRLAYGAAGTDKNMGFKEAKEAFEGWMQASAGSGVKVEFADDLALRFSMPPKGFVKTVLNFLILAAECSHGSGEIKVSVLEGSQGVEILTKGSKVKFREGAENALDGKIDIEDLDARLSHAYVSGKFVNYFNFNFEKEFSESSEELSMKITF